MEQATDLKTKISEAKTSVDETRLSIEKIKTQLEELKGEAEKDRDEIKKYKEESDQFKKSIFDTLELVTDKSLTNAFQKRKDQISVERYIWLAILIGSTAALAWAVIHIYNMQAGLPNGFDDWSMWYRYLFTSPLIFLVYLATTNYNLARSHLEKYAFKEVLSVTLTSYIKLLSTRYPDDKKETLEFTLKTIDSIYEKPYEDDKHHKTKLYFGWKNIINGGIELDKKAKASADVKIDESVTVEETK